MALTITQQEVFDKLNTSLGKAQKWLSENFPVYERAFAQFMKQLEPNCDLYYGIIGILIRMEHEGEQNFKGQLDREYILTEAVRDKVRAIIDSSESADARIDAWEALKELVEIK